MSRALLQISGLNRSYVTGDKTLDVLKGVELTVMPGEIVGLIGPSGSGKSSLLHAAGLLERPDAGTILIDGEDVGALDERGRTRLRLAKIGFNTLTGLKLQDVDQDRTVRLAARSALNELLTQTPNIGTYENLFIKNEDLMKLSPQEQRQYLLYRVLQSRAAREARERKRAQELADPMQMLGIG